jgi:uncharacterized protein YjdB
MRSLPVVVSFFCAIAFALCVAALGCSAPPGSDTALGHRASEYASAKTVTLASLAVSPAKPRLYVGTSEALTATGTLSNHTKETLTTSCTWTTSDATIATVSPDGNVTAVARGSVTITATDGTLSATSTVTVLGTLLSVAVTPASTTLPLGASETLRATGTFDNAATKNLTRTATWGTSDGTVVSVSTTGAVTAVGVGTATVSAVSSQSAPGPVTGTATFTVTAASLTGLAVTPATKKIPTGASQQFVATGTFSDGSTHVLGGASLAWTSSATSFATVSATGLVTAVAVGSSTITATDGGLSATATANITAVALESISVLPSKTTLDVGASTAFTALGNYSDGTQMDLSSQATWLSSNTTVATIASNGGLDALTAGTTTVSATYGKKVGTSAVTVVIPALQSLSISPGKGSLTVGMVESFTATGNYNDGSSADLTSSVAWSASPSGIVTLSASPCGTEVATAISSGTATLTALDPTSGLSTSVHIAVSKERAGTSVLSLQLVDPNSAPLTPSSAGNVSVSLRASFDGGTTFSANPTPDCQGIYNVLVPTTLLSIEVQSSGVPASGLQIPEAFQIDATFNVASDGLVTMTVPTTSLTVTVTDTSSNPIAGATVEMSDFSEGSLSCGAQIATCKGGFLTNDDVNGNSPALTNAVGEVQLYGFAIQNVGVSVLAPSGFANGNATFDASQSTTADIVLQSAAPQVPISFQLTDANSVILTPSNAPELQVFVGNLDNNVVPDGSGSYTASVTPGTVLVAATGNGGGLALPSSFEFGGYLAVTGALTTTIAIPATTLTVDVTDPNNNLVEGAQVSLSAGLRSFAACGGVLTSCQAEFSTSTDIAGNSPAVTDVNGNSSLYGFAESGVSVTAAPPSGSTFGAGSANDDASASNILDVSLTGPQPVALSFRFVDANAVPLTPKNEPGLQAFVGQIDNNVTPDAGGNYSVSALPGQVFLGAIGQSATGLVLPTSFGFGGYLNVTGATTIDIVVPAAAYVFDLTDPTGSPLVGASVVWSANLGLLADCGTQLTGCEMEFTSNADISGASPALTSGTGSVTLYGFGATSTSLSETPASGSGFLMEEFAVDATLPQPFNLQLQ